MAVPKKVPGAKGKPVKGTTGQPKATKTTPAPGEASSKPGGGNPPVKRVNPPKTTRQ